MNLIGFESSITNNVFEQRSVAELKAVNEGLKVENKRLRDEVVGYQEEHKEDQRTISELRDKVKELELKSLDVSQFMKWNWEQIHFWITTVENKRFKKYEAVLKDELSEAEMVGEDLLDVTPLVIKMWGIKDRKDRVALNAHIQNLVQQNGPIGAPVAPKDNLNEGAPTAFL